MRFREHKNKQIDIEWCFRGEASHTNWFEAPRHSTQVNLFLVQSIDGIMLYEIYDYNMNKDHYERKLPQIREQIDANEREFTYNMHDNAWRGARPEAALNESIGEGRWTRYMVDTWCSSYSFLVIFFCSFLAGTVSSYPTSSVSGLRRQA